MKAAATRRSWPTGNCSSFRSGSHVTIAKSIEKFGMAISANCYRTSIYITPHYFVNRSLKAPTVETILPVP